MKETHTLVAFAFNHALASVNSRDFIIEAHDFDSANTLWKKDTADKKCDREETIAMDIQLAKERLLVTHTNNCKLVQTLTCIQPMLDVLCLTVDDDGVMWIIVSTWNDFSRRSVLECQDLADQVSQVIANQPHAKSKSRHFRARLYPKGHMVLHQWPKCTPTMYKGLVVQQVLPHQRYTHFFYVESVCPILKVTMYKVKFARSRQGLTLVNTTLDQQKVYIRQWNNQHAALSSLDPLYDRHDLKCRQIDASNGIVSTELAGNSSILSLMPRNFSDLLTLSEFVASFREKRLDTFQSQLLHLALCQSVGKRQIKIPIKPSLLNKRPQIITKEELRNAQELSRTNQRTRLDKHPYDRDERENYRCIDRFSQPSDSLSRIHPRTADSVLVIFDYDWSLIDENSDTFIFSQLYPQLLATLHERRKSERSWTKLMNEMLNQLAQDKPAISPAMIRDAVSRAPIQSQMLNALRLASKQYNTQVKIVSDANSVYIESMLTARNLLPNVSEIITNPALFEAMENGRTRLRVSPYHSENLAPHGCKWCPTNMCKGQIVDSLRQAHPYITILYVGDGSGDFCAATRLTKNDLVFARADEANGKAYGLKARIDRHPTMVAAPVIPWRTGEDIYRCFAHFFHGPPQS